MNWSTPNNLSPLQQFSDAADSDDLDLTQMALLIALSEYPNLDLQLEQQSLDSLASAAAHRLDEEREPLARANILSEYLFDEVGFRANQENYYDPRNSYLNEVIERRLGIPITLSLLYMEVGKRLEMDLEGVGMPGHFLVRVKSSQEDILVDPFNRGIILSEQECARRLQQIVGDTVAWDKRYVAGVSDRQLITRILRNLGAIYAAANDYERVSRVDEWINALQVPPAGVTSP